MKTLHDLIPPRNITPEPVRSNYHQRGESERVAEMRRTINASSLSVRELAKQLGVSEQRVYMLRMPVRAKRLSKSEINRAIRLNDAGSSLDEIAAMHGISRTTLSKQLHHYRNDWYAMGVRLATQTNESIDSICERLELNVDKLVSML